MMSNRPRKISKETFEHLNPLEQIIGQQFILEGKWVLDGGQK